MTRPSHTEIFQRICAMGNWNITIQGTGSHHNDRNPRDAEKMAAAFVNELRAAGHQIEAALFTSGAHQDLKFLADLAAPPPFGAPNP